MKIFMPILFLAFLVSLTSCKKATEPVTINPYHDAYEEASNYVNLPEKAYDYSVDFPQYLKNSAFRAPKIDNEKATLGRVLFYDKKLSKTNEVSCASCHIQELAFADGKKVSDGINDRQTTRNSIGLGSTVNFGAYYGTASFFNINFFWDDRAKSVAEQATQSLASDLEMGMHMHEVVEKVKENQKYYKWLFMEAYPDGITEDNVLDAIQQFVNSMGSYHSPFDEGMNTHNGDEMAYFDELSPLQNQGKNIFMQHCTSCHSKFAARSTVPTANNGLYMVYEDKGVGARDNNSAFDGVFKVPSLRNIELTGPYMHDGSLETLEDVVEHYISGIKNHRNLASQLKTNGHPGLGLTEADKAPLVAFLKSFTDDSILTDERYADPFK